MGFFDRLKNGLFKTKNAIIGKIDTLFKMFRKVDEDLFDELEEILISADVGVNTTEEILDELREYVKDNKIKEPEQQEILVWLWPLESLYGFLILMIYFLPIWCSN